MSRASALALLVAGCGAPTTAHDAGTDAGADHARLADAAPGVDACCDDTPVVAMPDAARPEDGAVRDGGSGACGALPMPSADALAASTREGLVRYARDLPGGAYTNMGQNGGGPTLLAIASYAGNTSTDARLLQQIRYTLTGGNEPCANGGYPAQHELFMTSALALARMTPRVWTQLTAGEVQRADAVMEAALIGSAFTTSDANPYVAHDTQQYTLDGDSNVDRDWNPNYREGMLGTIPVVAAYLGGASAVDAMLRGYSHTAFVARLSSLGLTNEYTVFNWHAAHPGAAGPDAAAIETAVHAYAYQHIPVTSLMQLRTALTDYTFGATIACGIDGGMGIRQSDGTFAGVIASGCATLPNAGMQGECVEFASVDAEGQRSSAVYAFDAIKADLMGTVVMLAACTWPRGSATADPTHHLVLGATDFWYKLDHGYIGYSHGAPDDTVHYTTDTSELGLLYYRSMWDDVIHPFLGP